MDTILKKSLKWFNCIFSFWSGAKITWAILMFILHFSVATFGLLAILGTIVTEISRQTYFKFDSMLLYRSWRLQRVPWKPETERNNLSFLVWHHCAWSCVFWGENTGNETMPGQICLQKQYQEPLGKQRQARDAKPHDGRTRRNSAFPAPEQVAASPCDGERILSRPLSQLRGVQ